jgi:hypothetical protein
VGTTGLDKDKGIKAPNLEINLMDYGAKGDDSTNNDAAIAAALAAVPAGGCLVIPRGTYRYNTPFNLPQCVVSYKSRLKYMGASTTSCVTAGPDNYQLDHSRIIIDGQGHCTNGITYNNVRGGTVFEVQVTNVTGDGFHCDYCQGVEFTHPVVSNNVEAFTTTPTNGIQFGPLTPNSNNTIINPQFEKLTNAGILFTNAINNAVINGTSEGNLYGVQCLGGTGQLCSFNTIYKMDLEVNSGRDIYVYGPAAGNNTFRDLAASSPNSIFVDAGSGNAVSNLFSGGQTGSITLGPNAYLTKLEHFGIYGAEAGCPIDNGYGSKIYGVYNMSTATLCENKEPLNQKFSGTADFSGAATFGGAATFNGTANFTGAVNLGSNSPLAGHSLVLLTTNTTGAAGSWSHTFAPALSGDPNCNVSNATDNTVVYVSAANASGVTVSGQVNKYFNVQCWR